MEAPYVPFALLKSGRLNQRLVARLLRFWPARNIKKGGQLMGVDLLLLDEKGSIHVHHLPVFQSLLVEGSLYAISGFEVTRSSTRFKLTDFHMSIRFTADTAMVRVEQSLCNIPTEHFRFRSYDQLLALGNTNSELPDIIGEVCSTKSYHDETTEGVQRMLIHLRIESGDKVRVSAFDDNANFLHKLFSEKEAGICIMLATNMNPKFFGGDLYLNATTGSKFYFDGDVNATKSYLDRVSSKDSGNLPAEKYHGVQKIEHVSIAELNDFLFTSDLQEAEFLCTGKVVEIQPTKGWCYISCSKCAKKMTKTETTLACNNCYSPDAVGDVKYRVEMVVDDGSATSVFVAFDKDMVKLTNILAKTLAAKINDAETAVENDIGIPKVIADIVGKKYTFHIKLTSFNFTTQHQSFTVTRIFDKPYEVPTPTFVTQKDLNATLQPKSGQKGQSLPVLESTTSDGAPPNTNAEKKAPSNSEDDGENHMSPTESNNHVRKKSKHN
ncbi:uncharacterized protein LOC18011836 [Eutrema salsugineum]|uniref:uncharacterized protein LOC18011836 n=1 Tax=Eutrema salsugineum TaxID=72664 RepID=UPI000CED68CC|nr:uncharacterized protein LOC18011836 [Eutrema salsugineum]